MKKSSDVFESPEVVAFLQLASDWVREMPVDVVQFYYDHAASRPEGWHFGTKSDLKLGLEERLRAGLLLGHRFKLDDFLLRDPVRPEHIGRVGEETVFWLAGLGLFVMAHPSGVLMTTLSYPFVVDFPSLCGDASVLRCRANCGLHDSRC